MYWEKGEILLQCAMFVISAIFGVVASAVTSVIAKWIWGILAIAAFGFSVFMLIEAILSKRKERRSVDSGDFAKRFFKAAADYAREHANDPEFQKELAERLIRRATISDGQRPDEDNYGYCEKNPVCTASISASNSSPTPQATQETKLTDTESALQEIRRAYAAEEITEEEFDEALDVIMQAEELNGNPLTADEVIKRTMNRMSAGKCAKKPSFWTKPFVRNAIGVVLLISVALIFFFVGRDKGYNEGYDTGTNIGRNKGYVEGHGKGYDEGYTKGYAEGCDDGQVIGYNEGYREGYNKGYAEGFLDARLNKEFLDGWLNR